MAFIREIIRKGSEKFKIDRTQILAELSVARNSEGDAFLNIRTRGSVDREKHGVANQKLQLGPEAIAQLKSILEGV